VAVPATGHNALTPNYGTVILCHVVMGNYCGNTTSLYVLPLEVSV